MPLITLALALAAGIAQIAVLGVYDVQTDAVRSDLDGVLEAEVKVEGNVEPVPHPTIEQAFRADGLGVYVPSEAPGLPSQSSGLSLDRCPSPSQLAQLLQRLSAPRALAGFLDESPTGLVMTVRVFDESQRAYTTEASLHVTGIVHSDLAQAFQTLARRALGAPSTEPMGTVELNTDPEAKVSLDGQRAPAAGHWQLPPGTHHLRVARGDDSGEGTFDVLAGETLSYDALLAPHPAPKRAHNDPTARLTMIGLGVLALGATAGLIALDTYDAKDNFPGGPTQGTQDGMGTLMVVTGAGGLFLIGAGLFDFHF